jgi:HAD superfamily hydrolase (TIGR01509 family)
MKQTQAVILDLDGLMIDSEPLHQRAFELLLARHGVDHMFTEDEYGRSFVGIPVKENAEWLVAHFDLKGAQEDLIAEREQIYEELLGDPANLIPMPGLFGLLDDLSARGLPLGVASGSPRNQVDVVLRGLQIAARFRTVVAGDDVPHTKPAPDVYRRATEELGVAPARCVAIEDSVTGITAAKAAGLRAIAVPNRYTAHQDLSRADARVEGLVQVMDLLK